MGFYRDCAVTLEIPATGDHEDRRKLAKLSEEFSGLTVEVIENSALVSPLVTKLTIPDAHPLKQAIVQSRASGDGDEPGQTPLGQMVLKRAIQLLGRAK